MSEDLEKGPVDEMARALLRERVESFEQLEALLLLHAHRDRAWSPEAVAEELRIQTPEAEAALEHLCRNALLGVRVGSKAVVFAYNPGSPDLADAVDRLARAYDDSRLEIMRLMSRSTIERVRTQALRVFADAFVVGRRKKDG